MKKTTNPLIQLIENNKLDNDQLIRLLKISRSEEIQIAIASNIQWKTLNKKQKDKTRYAFKGDNCNVVLQTMHKQGMSVKEIVDFFANYRVFFARDLFDFLKTQRCSFKEIFSYGQKANNHYLWSYISEMPEWKNLSRKRILALVDYYEKNRMKFRGWPAAIRTKRLNVEEMLHAYSEFPFYEVTQAIADIAKDLRIDSKTLLNFCICLYEREPQHAERAIVGLINKGILNEKELFQLAERKSTIRGYDTWAAVMTQSKQSAEDLLAYAKLHNNREEILCGIICSKKLDSKKAFDLTVKMDDYMSYRSFLQTYKPSLEQSMFFLNKSGAHDFVSSRFPWNEISLKACIRICKNPNLGGSGWISLVKNRTLSSDEMITIGLHAKSDYVWELIAEKLCK